MTDRDWIVPSVLLTALIGLVAWASIPASANVHLTFDLLPLWMIIGCVMASVYGWVVMIASGVRHPISFGIDVAMREWRRILTILIGIFVAGINMITFLWIKPVLNYYIPFRADAALASIDNTLFLGNDPWTLLVWLNCEPLAIFYHYGWFALMIMALIVVLTAPSSPEKSAIMLTYFLLWSVIGPAIHVMTPAAGPIFFAQLGYGDRFAGLHHVSATREIADFLWSIYAGNIFGAGAGISAMPSLHVATTTWIALATYHFERRMLLPVSLAAGLIALLSVALGWHYASDGIVGSVVTILCFRVLRACFIQRSSQDAAARLMPAGV